MTAVASVARRRGCSICCRRAGSMWLTASRWVQVRRATRSTAASSSAAAAAWVGRAESSATLSPSTATRQVRCWPAMRSSDSHEIARGAGQRADVSAVGGGGAHFAGLGVAGQQQAQLALGHGLDDDDLPARIGGIGGVGLEGIGDGAAERAGRIDRFGLVGRRRQADAGRTSGRNCARRPRCARPARAACRRGRRGGTASPPSGCGAGSSCCAPLGLQRLPGGAGDGDGGDGGQARRPGAIEPAGLADEQAFLAQERFALPVAGAIANISRAMVTAIPLRLGTGILPGVRGGRNT